MHILYLAALILYLLGGLAFVMSCCGVALVWPQYRVAALRTAASMMGTYPGVFLYQFLSLPLMLLLFAGGMVLVSLPPVSAAPEAILVSAAICFVAFAGVSLAGFRSGWRVVAHALRERPWWAALRRDSIVAAILKFSETTPFRWILSRRLFSRSADPLGAWDIIRWWEVRRIPFNALVGSAGLLTLGLLSWVRIQSQVDGSQVSLMPETRYLIAAVLAYGVVANLCYSVGWLAELGVSRIIPSSTAQFASVTCALGFGFSILLTISPGLFGLLLWTAQRIPG